MTIHDPKKFCEGLWDWGILDGCFGTTKIRPTDSDGWTERRGKFLLLEAKQPNANVPYGQMLMYEALRRTGVFTVIIVWGKSNLPEQAQVLTRHEIHKPIPCDLAKLRSITANWYRWADSTPVPQPIWSTSASAA